MKSSSTKRLELAREWLVVVLALFGSCLATYNYVHARNASRLSDELQADGWLDQAWDLLGGQEGTQDLEKVIGTEADMVQAGRLIEKAIKKAPWYAKAHRVRAFYLHEVEGRVEEAEDSYRQAIRLDPEYIRAYNNLGVLLRRLGRTGDAEEVYRQALATSPRDTRTNNQLASLLSTDPERFQEAEKHYLLALETNRGFARAYINLGNLYAKDGRNDEAERNYRLALMYEPRSNRANRNIGTFLARQGREQEAEGFLRQAIEIDPRDNEALNNLGILLSLGGRHHEAEQCFRQAIEVNSLDKRAHLNLGFALAELNRPEEAEVVLEQAISLDPNYAQALDKLGEILQGQGRNLEADAYFQRAAESKRP